MVARSCARLAVLLCLSLVLTAVRAGDGVPFERRLPNRVVLFARTASLSATVDRAGRSAWGGLAADPSMKGFRESLLTSLESSHAVSLGSVADLIAAGATAADSEIAVAVLADDSEGLVSVLTIEGIEPAVFEARLARWTEALRALGGTAPAASKPGDPIVLTVPTTPAGNAARPRELVVLHRAGRVVLTPSRAAMRDILARWNAPAPTPASAATDAAPATFESSPARAAVRRELGSAPAPAAIEWFLDPVRLAQRGAGSVRRVVVENQLRQLGLDSLQAIGGTVSFAEPPFDTAVQAVAILNGPARGLPAVFPMPPTALALPGWIPASSSSAVVFNWDAPQGWIGFRNLVDGVAGAGRLNTVLDALAKTPDGPGVVVERDLIQKLAGPVTVVQGVPADPSVTGAGPAQPLLLGAALSDPAGFSSLLPQLARQPGLVRETREVNGTVVYDLAVSKNRLLVAVAHDTLLLANDPKLMTDCLSASASLVRDDALQPLLRQLPKRASLVACQRNSAQLRSAWELLRRLPKSEGALIDFSLLPDFDKVQPRFPDSASWAASTDSGFQYTAFTLSPALNP